LTLETGLSLLSFVDNPQREANNVRKQQEDEMPNVNLDKVNNKVNNNG